MKRSVLSMMLVAGLLVVSPAWGAGLWLYENGTPDLGTAAAGRAAMASDASTAGANPAGTGASYFEVRIDGRPVNPVQWLKATP